MISPYEFGILMVILVASVGYPVVLIAGKLSQMIFEIKRGADFELRRNDLAEIHNSMLRESVEYQRLHYNLSLDAVRRANEIIAEQCDALREVREELSK